MKAARDAFYLKEAFEFEKSYVEALDDDEIALPLTRAGFEILLNEACRRRDLPADDGCRSVFAGFVHHIENNRDTTTLQDIGVVLHKSISNGMTWQVDQDVKKVRRDEELAQSQLDKTQEESTPLTLVGDSSDVPPSPQGT